jgi:hypothetical protein
LNSSDPQKHSHNHLHPNHIVDHHIVDNLILHGYQHEHDHPYCHSYSLYHQHNYIVFAAPCASSDRAADAATILQLPPAAVPGTARQKL